MERGTRGDRETIERQGKHTEIVSVLNMTWRDREKGGKLGTQVKGIKEGMCPTLFYPPKAIGILQAQAKTNIHALKSLVHNPCVIIQAASPHRTKTQEYKGRDMYVCVCLFEMK